MCVRETNPSSVTHKQSLVSEVKKNFSSFLSPVWHINPRTSVSSHFMIHLLAFAHPLKLPSGVIPWSPLTVCSKSLQYVNADLI